MAKGKIKESRLLGGWKKKQWFTILAPKAFDERPVGETPAFNPEKVVGRTVSVNLMVLTGNIKKQNMSAILEIQKVVGDKAYTFLKGYEVMPAYLRRIVRRGRDRIDQVIKCKTSDNKVVVIKLFLMTAGLTNSKQLKALRHDATQFVIEKVGSVPFAELMMDIISGKLHRDVKIAVKKIFPLKSVEIKTADLVIEKDMFGKTKVPEGLDLVVKPAVAEETEEPAVEEKPKKKFSKKEDDSEEAPAVEEKPKKKPSKKKEEKAEEPEEQAE